MLEDLAPASAGMEEFLAFAPFLSIRYDKNCGLKLTVFSMMYWLLMAARSLLKKIVNRGYRLNLLGQKYEKELP